MKFLAVFLLMTFLVSGTLGFVLPIPLPVPLLEGLDANLALGDQPIFVSADH